MMDPVSSQATQKLAEQALQQGGPQSQLQEAAGQDVARFQEAMGQQPEHGLQQSPAATAPGVESAGAAGLPSDNLGDAILQGLERMKSVHDARMNNIQDKISEVNGGEMTIQQALALQFEVMQMGIEQDLTTKVADKTSQGVQTLFRNQ